MAWFLFLVLRLFFCSDVLVVPFVVPVLVLVRVFIFFVLSPRFPTESWPAIVAMPASFACVTLCRVQVHGPAFSKMFQMLRIGFVPQVKLIQLLHTITGDPSK